MSKFEKFDFSKPEDQKQFDSLPKQAKEVLIDAAQVEANKIHSQKNKSTNENAGAKEGISNRKLVGEEFDRISKSERYNPRTVKILEESDENLKKYFEYISRGEYNAFRCRGKNYEVEASIDYASYRDREGEFTWKYRKAFIDVNKKKEIVEKKLLRKNTTKTIWEARDNDSILIEDHGSADKKHSSSSSGRRNPRQPENIEYWHDPVIIAENEDGCTFGVVMGEKAVLIYKYSDKFGLKLTGIAASQH